MHEAAKASLPDLEMWLPWAVGYHRSVTQRFIRESGAAWGDGRAFDFAVRAHDDPDRHIGNVSVWWVSQQNHIGEVGYWIRSDRTGEGVGTEITAKAVQIGFEEIGFHKIVLRIAVGNVGSEAIARKLGFAFEGTLREEVKVGDRWIDHTAWSLLDRDWWEQRTRLRAQGMLA
jgi:RimJ/RimL family protein N-acetyltransferase